MTKTISQRIALAGSEEIRNQLAALGEWGEKAFRDIQAAEKLKGPDAEFARNMTPRASASASWARSSTGSAPGSATSAPGSRSR